MKITALIAFALLLVPNILLAQSGYRDFQYEPGNMITIQGYVEYRDTILSHDGYVPLTRVRLSTVQSPLGQTYVVLGPWFFFKQSNIRLRAGDFICVYGQLVNVCGIPSIVATRVVQGGNSIHLRTSSGVPLYPIWSKMYGTPPPPSNF